MLDQVLLRWIFVIHRQRIANTSFQALHITSVIDIIRKTLWKSIEGQTHALTQTSTIIDEEERIIYDQLFLQNEKNSRKLKQVLMYQMITL